MRGEYDRCGASPPIGFCCELVPGDLDGQAIQVPIRHCRSGQVVRSPRPRSLRGKVHDQASTTHFFAHLFRPPCRLQFSPHLHHHHHHDQPFCLITRRSLTPLPCFGGLQFRRLDRFHLCYVFHAAEVLSFRCGRSSRLCLDDQRRRHDRRSLDAPNMASEVLSIETMLAVCFSSCWDVPLLTSGIVSSPSCRRTPSISTPSSARSELGILFPDSPGQSDSPSVLFVPF